MNKTGTGILGGTFDPPHLGHRHVARAAAEALGLARVVFVPALVSPYKAAPAASFSQRLAMTEAALPGAAPEGVSFVASALDGERPPPSYTIDLLEALAERHTDWAPFALILGADAAAGLPGWRDVGRILARVVLAVVPRPGATPDDLVVAWRAHVDQRGADPSWDADAVRLAIVHAPPEEISATDVRRRVATGESIAALVAPAVAAYVAEHRLYRPAV